MNNTPLNPGIVKTVQWLNGTGFKTCDSGDGETHDHACDIDQPYVYIECPKHSLIVEADRLERLLNERGIRLVPTDESNTLPNIQATYSPGDKHGFIMLFNVKL